MEQKHYLGGFGIQKSKRKIYLDSQSEHKTNDEWNTDMPQQTRQNIEHFFLLEPNILWFKIQFIQYIDIGLYLKSADLNKF